MTTSPKAAWGYCLVAASLLTSATALAQEDPCLTLLEGTPKELARYEQEVERYLDARDAAKLDEQLDALRSLQSLCAQNLRLEVLEGDVLRQLERCDEAQARYDDVLSRAQSWPDRVHADDARAKAEAGQSALADDCQARVSVRCADTGVSVRVDQGAVQPCPASLVLFPGEHDFELSAEGKQSLTRSYTVQKGNNFIEIEALAALERAGTVDFDCEAPGVVIRIGSQEIACPGKGSFAAGMLSYTVLAPGEAPSPGTVQVIEKQSVRVWVPAATDANLATLDVDCAPGGAELTLSSPALADDFVAKCPVVLELPPGEYTLSATYEGREPATDTVSLVAGQSQKRALVLHRPSPLHFVLRLLGGAAFAMVPDEYDSSDYEAEQAMAATRLGAHLVIDLDTTNSLVIGVLGRVVFGDEAYVLGSVLFDYFMRVETLAFWFGGGYGYGDAGALSEECWTEETEAGEWVEICDYEPAGTGGVPEFHFGFGVELGSGVGLVFDMSVLLATNLVMDVLGGLSYTF